MQTFIKLNTKRCKCKWDKESGHFYILAPSGARIPRVIAVSLYSNPLLPNILGAEVRFIAFPDEGIELYKKEKVLLNGEDIPFNFISTKKDFLKGVLVTLKTECDIEWT